MSARPLTVMGVLRDELSGHEVGALFRGVGEALEVGEMRCSRDEYRTPLWKPRCGSPEPN